MDETELRWQLAGLFNEAEDAGMAPEDVKATAEGYIKGRQWGGKPGAN
jgi:hypothetical protein